MIWVGSKLWRGVYGAWQQAAYVLFIVYFGVVVSDMVRMASLPSFLLCARGFLPSSHVLLRRFN